MKISKTLGVSGMAAAAAVALGLSAVPQSASAQPIYIGEIFPVGFNFCPRGTAQLDGQILAISSNTALFSLLGTTFGGDGRSTFALPDMRGRMAFHIGSGPGLTSHSWGQKGGTTATTVTTAQLPAHRHNLGSVNQTADKGGPASDFFAKASDGAKTYHNGPADALLDPNIMQTTGGGQQLQIAQPYQAINWCIMLQGVFPSRS